MSAHAAYTWVVTHLPKPLMQPIGTVQRRGKSGSSVISDFLARRRVIFLCATCEHKMPFAWCRRWEYRLLPDLHSDGTRCDSCQQMDSTNIYTPEDGGYYQEVQRSTRTAQRAAAQQVLIRDHRRIPGTD